MGTTIDPTLFQGFASPMTPGQSGVGGFVAPTAADPWTSASQTGNIGNTGTDWTKLASALQSASKSLQGQSGESSGGSSKQQTGSQALTQTGQPRAAVSLDNLVKMLEQRGQGYMQSVMGGPQGATPQTQKQTTYGLLGY
jgi:hypothetical protein